ncbi:hypothetical protein [Ruegeria sp.]|uniref:hypothetical protein n=1 Tax=Ruegeria sp. TaxID=1879320 RepID=UPI00308112D1
MDQLIGIADHCIEHHHRPWVCNDPGGKVQKTRIIRIRSMQNKRQKRCQNQQPKRDPDLVGGYIRHTRGRAGRRPHGCLYRLPNSEQGYASRDQKEQGRLLEDIAAHKTHGQHKACAQKLDYDLFGIRVLIDLFV